MVCWLFPATCNRLANSLLTKEFKVTAPSSKFHYLLCLWPVPVMAVRFQLQFENMQDLTQLDSLIRENGMLCAQQPGYLSDFLSEAQRFSVKMNSGEGIDCYLSSVSTEAPNILYFHNTATKDFKNLAETAKNLALVNLNFIAVEYCASLPQGLCYSDLLRRGGDLIDGVGQWLESNGLSGSLFLMGQSIGNNVILQSAVSNSGSVKGLILEDLVGDTVSFFKMFNPDYVDLALTENDGFKCLELIADIKAPTLFFHGAKDNLVSTRDAEKLQSYSGARTKQFYIIPGAERGMLQMAGGALYFETIRKFTETVCGTNTWRDKRRKFKAGLQ